MRLSTLPLFDAENVQSRVAALAAEIARDYAEARPLCLCVLKGGVPFAADLVRQFDFPMELDFIRVKSYAGTASTGQVELLYTPEIPLAGRAVVLLEDIVDTGQSAAALLHWCRRQGPASIRICTFLDKPARRTVTLAADYVGYTIEDHFVVGYGMDYNELYRGLPAVYTLEAD